jgi:hypothetical protein
MFLCFSRDILRKIKQCNNEKKDVHREASREWNKAAVALVAGFRTPKMSCGVDDIR